MNDSELKPIVEQASSLLELVFDEAMRRASERGICQMPISGHGLKFAEAAC